MSFRFYEIVSQLVPGFILYVVVCEVGGIPFDSIPQVPTLAIALFLGYMNNTLSSWIEGILFWTWGGKPSSRLLDGGQIWKVSFHRHEMAKKLLIDESGRTSVTNDELFEIAENAVGAKENIRIQSFNESYAFSRSILFCSVIIALMLNIYYWLSIWIAVLSILLIYCLWLRCKQRAYYFVREVLGAYICLTMKDRAE